MFKQFISAILLFSCILPGKLNAQNLEYPYPVYHFTLQVENKTIQMAYMDITPSTPNGETIILFHGKNFNGYYWKDVIPFLASAGYRVIVPDQVGWGKSSKPDLHYSFHMLAENNRRLLDSLNIHKIIVLGHSMGGMLACRFTLMYPSYVSKLILENPIGLEDYKTFVPYQSLEVLYKKEMGATYESYKKYQQSYYPRWEDKYEQYVRSQAEALSDPMFSSIAWANALTYQMIYEQPVCYEFGNINVPALLIIGQADRTIVGKDKLSPSVVAVHGIYPKLAKKVSKEIKGSRLIEIPGVGHIPHIQDLPAFKKAVITFLNRTKG